ncbi:DNA methyltransferase [Rhodanobacter terrae]|uniref:site-specific DNA-methyltransferase (adenine-specific) n=1 Tax=Rhodanobacter terrae TaxID=418647 RepID=A0ABW0SVD6_9GAMM
MREYPDQEQRQTAYTHWYRESRSQLWPFEDYKFIDDGGIYTGMRAVHNPGKEGYRYDVIHPVTGNPCRQPMMGYRFPEGTMRRLVDEGRILFGDNESKLVELKVYAKDYRSKLSSLFELDGRIGTNEIKAIFPESKRPFDFPKPVELIEELLSFTTSGNDIVLDSFAGSGTTGQAVMTLNQADGQHRRFVLTEMKPSIARGVTSERIRRVVEGYGTGKGEVPGLGGGFRYATLGKPLFAANGHINPDVRFAELARFVWFVETGTPLAGKAPASPLLGVHAGRAVYLLYNGILKDKSAGGGNVLTSPLLDELPPHEGPRVIYGTRCLIKPERLRHLGITFKQLPYDLKVTR